MRVIRVRTVSGSHPEPPMDDAWSPLEKLQWKAALAEHDTGLTIRVTVGKEWKNGVPVPGVFHVQVGGTSSIPGDFHDTWFYITAVVIGAQETGRKHD